MLTCAITGAEAGLPTDRARHLPLNMNLCRRDYKVNLVEQNHFVLLHGVEVFSASPPLREHSLAGGASGRHVVSLVK